MDTNMNLNKELLARIEDMSQAEQELLLASLTAKKGNETWSVAMSHDERTDFKDNLVYLAFAALDNDVPPRTVFDGAFYLFEKLRS